MSLSFHHILLAAAIAGFAGAEVPDEGLAETNAAAIYRKAFDLLDGSGEQERQWLKDPGARNDAAAQDWFRRVDESVALLHRAAEMPFRDWGTVDKRSATGLSRIAGWRYEGQPPEPETVVRDQLAVLALSRHVGRDGGSFDKWIEIGLDATAIDNLRRQLHRMPQDVLADLRRKLQSLPPPEEIGKVFEADIAARSLDEMTKASEAMRDEMIKGFTAAIRSSDDASSFAHELRLASVVMAEGSRFQIGLEEKESGAGFLLRLGQRKRGVELVSVDFDRGEAVLMKGGQRALVRLKSREIVPLSLPIVQEGLVYLFGEEAARRIHSEEDLEAAFFAMLESSREELRQEIAKMEFVYANVPIREGEGNLLQVSTNLFTELHLRGMRNAYRQAALAHTKHLLLDAAIDVSIHGEDALAHHADPFGDGPFAYEMTEQGFILRSKIENHGEKMALRIGPPD